MRAISTILVFNILANGLQAADVATKIQKENVLLSRGKRYVQWPKGSNFVINFTCTKPLLRYQPLTWNTVYEMDIPFAALIETKSFFGQASKSKRHVLERKNLLGQLEDLMFLMGLNGRACVNRLLCESKIFLETKERPMLRELIRVLFSSYMDDELLNGYSDRDCDADFSLCPMSVLALFVNSTNEDINSSYFSVRQ
ncbi:uncharacterized protein LOC109546913 [Dendroctonus ponderosae]|uniref:Uncharacterized protein n=1 Tax=Dendroctonus ponderosae TaxID=77166 RepID=U4UF66_DENPD|nr:uncharacterized protein LOC109546913 [Dendroctonus ponderosae]XP_019773646.2 uncharacterized protein LOC109546913 [Dendroctonus ponderosae]ERL92619.1 hypothetical protein D910_09932 [Dendroctonus ponderosae]KAH1014460.1 hypothetical protein HUJ05_012322 [Dendroctonus ponderosae]